MLLLFFSYTNSAKLRIDKTFISTLLDFSFFLSYNKKEERNEKGRARRC